MKSLVNFGICRFLLFYPFPTFVVFGYFAQIRKYPFLGIFYNIRQAIESEIPEANEHGGNNSKMIHHVDNIGSTGRSYSIAVLKRDAPEIPEANPNGGDRINSTIIYNTDKQGTGIENQVIKMST